jgi:hypothetical protein
MIINTPELLERRDVCEWNFCFTGRYFADTSAIVRWSEVYIKAFLCFEEAMENMTGKWELGKIK